jgi:hypothetical protein
MMNFFSYSYKKLTMMWKLCEFSFSLKVKTNLIRIDCF